jgi:hypothetical protein
LTLLLADHLQDELAHMQRQPTVDSE